MKIALKRVSAPGMPLWEKLLARLINWATGSSGYFHAELCFPRNWSFTADPCAGVVFWQHAWRRDSWTFFDLGSADEAHVEWWALKHCGERYDFLGAASCDRWLGKLCPWVKHWRAHLYCSLAVARALRFRRGFPVINSPKVSPNDLFRLCKQLGYAEVDN